MKVNKVFQNKTYRNMFLIVAPTIFILLLGVIYISGLLPQELAPNISVTETPKPNAVVGNLAQSIPETKQVKPIHITIASVGINTTVEEPASREIIVLDNALLKGAVYYPGSGGLNGGNALIFGHSTGLSVVHNQAFKTFNNLKNIKAGDEISVTGDDGEVYVYKALSVELVNQSEELVEFNTAKNMITLSTCNTFGQKQERHVVKAVFDKVLTIAPDAV